MPSISQVISSFPISRVLKCSYEVQKKDLLLPPLPPVSPAQKPAKMAQKRHNNESSACCQLPATINSTAKSKSNHKDPFSSKHRKMEEKHYEYSKSNKVGEIC